MKNLDNHAWDTEVDVQVIIYWNSWVVKAFLTVIIISEGRLKLYKQQNQTILVSLIIWPVVWDQYEL